MKAKLKAIGLWSLQVVGALMFLMAGLPKLFGQAVWADLFGKWGFPDHFYLVIGLVEVLAAVALVIPRFSGYGAATLAVVMLGAFITHWTHSEMMQARFTGIVFLVLCLLAYARLPVQLLSRRSRSAEGA